MSGEAHGAVPCFGSECAVLVAGAGVHGDPADAVAAVRRALLREHDRFTRFEPSSELSRLNADPRAEVPVSAPMAGFTAAAVLAAAWTGGLVDATLLGELEAAGYRGDLASPPPAPRPTVRTGPAGPHPAARWRSGAVDRDGAVVRRPPGVRLDGGGLVKGLAADMLAAGLGTHHAFAVDCAGDLRIGGTGGVARPVHVAAPCGGDVLHTFRLRAAEWPRAGSAAGASPAPTANPRTTCSTRPPAARRSPAWSR